MQRTTNPMSKHPSYNNQPTPTLQLLSKLSSFQGAKTDEINRRAFDLRPQQPQQQPMQPSYNEIKAGLPPVGPNYNSNQNGSNLPSVLDPNRRPTNQVEQSQQRPSTAGRSKYDSHMNSSMGKILLSDPASLPESVPIPGKRMIDPTVSNADGSLIGGQRPSGDPFLSTTQLMGTVDKDQKNAKSSKKMLRGFEPELFVSPITGQKIADYGNWTQSLTANKATPAEEEDSGGDEDEESKDPLLTKVRNQLSLRGAKGVLGLGRAFRRFDEDGSKALSFNEFRSAMKGLGMVLSEAELAVLFRRFDRQRTGAVSCDDFLSTLAGKLNGRRRRMVDMAFAVLDKDQSGELTIGDMAMVYDTSHHPDILSGAKTHKQVLLDLLSAFEGSADGDNNNQRGDGKVTKDEWYDYYRGISASIPSDEYFELMIRNAWHISGGSGSSANSSNKRVLVTHSDGSQSVVEIINDLGLKAGDTADIIRRLRAQGVDVAAIDTSSSGSGEKGFGNKQMRIADPGDQSGAPPPSSSNSPAAKKKGSKHNKPSSTGSNPIAELPSAGLKLLLTRIKAEMKGRGVTGFVGLQRRFRIMDDDGSGSLSFAEFKKAMAEIKVSGGISEADLRQLFAFFDSDSSGSISFEEFVQAVREEMNERRKRLVGMAFNVLDKDGSGEVDGNEIASCYDASKHPEVLAKRKTPAAVLKEFLDTFDVGGVKDGKVTRQEFENYYGNLSASIDNDDYFELMIRNAWHLAGGSGQSANTTNMAVLVTDPQGNERRVIIQNDLGLKKDNLPGIYARLLQQGEPADTISAINGKTLKLLNVNGTTVVTASGEVSQLKQDKVNLQQAAPRVMRAPPPPPAPPVNGIAASAMNRIAGANPSQPGGPSSSNLQSAPSAVIAQQVAKGMADRSKTDMRAAGQRIVGDTLLQVLRAQLLAPSRDGTGLIDLQRKFRQMDTDGSGQLSLPEFIAALLRAGVALSEEQLQVLFNHLDQDRSGQLDFKELLQGLRGPLPTNLLVLIHQVFDMLDPRGTDALSPQELILKYDASRHPAVMAGVMTAEQALQAFLDTFDVGGQRPGKVTRADFVDYYHNIAAAVDDEEYLTLVLRRCWHMREEVPNSTIQMTMPDQNYYQQPSNGNNSGRGRNSIAAAQQFDRAVNGQQQQRPMTAGGAMGGGGNRGGMGVLSSTVPMVMRPAGDQGTFAAIPSMPSNNSRRPNSARADRVTRPMNIQQPEAAAAYANGLAQHRISELQKEAVSQFNASKFRDAEQNFRQLLAALQSVYPPGHPECLKAEKSILMVQRKAAMPLH